MKTSWVRSWASSPDPAQQRTALGLILDPSLDIRETQFMLHAGERESSRQIAQQFVRDHHDEIMKRIPSDGTAQGQAWLAFVLTGPCTADTRDEVVAYVNTHFAKLQGGGRTVKQAIEGLDQCIARRKVIEPELRAWLGGGRGGSAVKAKASP